MTLLMEYLIESLEGNFNAKYFRQLQIQTSLVKLRLKGGLLNCHHAVEPQFLQFYHTR